MEPADNGKGKAFTIADDKGPRELVLHSKQGVYLCSAYEQFEDLKEKIFGTASILLQTKFSHLLIMGSETLVMVYDLKEKSVLFEKKFNYIYSLTLSPSETYVQILDKIDSN